MEGCSWWPVGTFSGSWNGEAGTVPQYLLYGAGEGGFDRFTLASQVNEIHCCLFSVMFCYGLIPTSCLLVWLGRKLRRIDAAMTSAVIGLLAESFFSL